MDGKIVGKCSLLMKKLIVLFVMTAVMVSCSKEENEQTYQEELEPLRIGCISFSDKKVNSAYKNGQSIANAVTGKLLRYKDEEYISSDSSIRYTGCLPWINPKEEHKDKIETASLRSSENSLKSKGIGIFRLSSKGYPVAQNNIHYAYNYDENDWSPSDKSNPVYLGKTEAPLCAYYPYNTASSNGNITLTSQLYSDDADFCYQTGKTASSESGDVSFTLNHAYAKITFIFKREESYSGSGAVSKISISGENILSSNTLDIKTGSYGIGTSGEVTVNPGITFIESGGTASTEVLLVPVEQLIGKVTFTFTIDGSESVGVFSPSVDEFNKFEAGKNYAIKIDIATSFVIVSGETANCYMLAPGKSIGIPIDVKGNGNPNAVAGTGLDVHHTAKSVGIIWETSPNLISLNGFKIGNQAVQITANNTSQTGNAVIAAYSGADQTGDILWSWHIWVTDYNPDSSTVQNGNIYTIANTKGYYTWMDRNLGATTVTPARVTTMGLLYQWGRKDPFPGADKVYIASDQVYTSLPIYNANGTILTEESGTSGTGIKHEEAVATTGNKTLNLENSIKNPMTYYLGTSVNETYVGYDWYTISAGNSEKTRREYQNDLLWGAPDTLSSTNKTIFDPCPQGWRVPAWNGASPWNWRVKAWSDTDYGYRYNKTYYPATGARYFTSGLLYCVGKYGHYWTASSGTSRLSSDLYFDPVNKYPTHFSYRDRGFSVRCVRE